jgi:cell division protein FtsN
VKKRVFYVINLDKSRILVLGVLITGFLLISFATGYRFGSTGSPIDNRDLGAMQAQEEALMDPSRQGLERSLPADEPSLQPPAAEERSPSAPAPAREPERPARREPARLSAENRTRRPAAAVREEKKERAPKAQPREQKPAQREQKAQRPARTEPKQTSRRDQRAKNEPEEKRREPARQTQAVKLEPEKSMRMSNTAGNQAPAVESAPKPASPMRSLQLGSFTSRAAADRMEAQLKKQGFETAVVSVRGKFAVRVGRSASDADISRLERQLKQKNYSPVRINLP